MPMLMDTLMDLEGEKSRLVTPRRQSVRMCVRLTSKRYSSHLSTFTANFIRMSSSLINEKQVHIYYAHNNVNVKPNNGQSVYIAKHVQIKYGYNYTVI